MKIFNKFLIILLFVFSIANADTTFIDEPILNSNVYVQTHGDKNNEVVVFVHGLGDEASTIWESSIEKLKENYYVITFDLPGFGKSSKLDAEYTPTKYALFVDYVVSKYTNKPFYLVGHSMGGAISLKYVNLFEEKVKKLFLIDAAGVLHKDAYSHFLIKMGIDRFLNIENVDNVNNKISNFISNISSGLNKIVPGDLYSMVRNETLRKNVFQSNPTSIAAVGLVTETFSGIENIKIPTFILWGENDEIAPLRTGYVLNKLIKNSELRIIKNSGHVPILDSKDIYLEYLVQFLEDKIEKKKKEERVYVDKDLDFNKKENIKLSCNMRNLRIINSKNIKVENCNLKSLYIRNSTVSILNSNIISDNTALSVIDSKVSITASDISGNIAIDTFNSKLDIAATNLNAKDISIFSRKTNEIIFSLTTLRNPITNKILHRKVEMLNNNKL